MAAEPGAVVVVTRGAWPERFLSEIQGGDVKTMGLPCGSGCDSTIVASRKGNRRCHERPHHATITPDPLQMTFRVVKLMHLMARS